MLVAHRRPERQLHVDRHRDCNRKRLKWREPSQRWRGELLRDRALHWVIQPTRRGSSTLHGTRAICQRAPKFGGGQRDKNKQTKESLRDAGVKDANLIF